MRTFGLPEKFAILIVSLVTALSAAKTNPQGVHRLRIDFDAVEPSYPMSLDITGQVEDVNRQAWAGRTSMIVHPSDVSLLVDDPTGRMLILVAGTLTVIGSFWLKRIVEIEVPCLVDVDA